MYMVIRISFKKDNLKPLTNNQMQSYTEFCETELKKTFPFPSTQVDVDLTNDSEIFEIKSDIPEFNQDANEKYEALCEQVRRIIDFPEWKSSLCPLPRYETFEEFQEAIKNMGSSLAEWYGFDGLPEEKQEEIENTLKEWFSFSANCVEECNGSFNFLEGETDINHFPPRIWKG